MTWVKVSEDTMPIEGNVCNLLDISAGDLGRFIGYYIYGMYGEERWYDLDGTRHLDVTHWSYVEDLPNE